MPKVSVIVATYKRENQLDAALESLCQQSYRDFEIIVVDDNIDQTWNENVSAIISKFKYKVSDIEIKHINHDKHLGSAMARNVGIDTAEGEYICFLDDDDIFLQNRIKNQVEAMEKANADFSLTDLALYNENDELIEVRRREYLANCNQEDMVKQHLKHHMTGTDVMMFRKDYLVKIGKFDPIDVGDEFYLMLKAIESNGRFLYLSICDVKAYVHTGEGGLSSGKSKIDGENNLFEFKKQYFHRLDRSSVRYIKMRHYAVLGFAGIRNRKWGYALKNCIYSFMQSPVQCIKLYLERNKR